MLASSIPKPILRTDHAMTAASSLQLLVDPLSPLVLRSGRPFGANGQPGAPVGASTPLPGTLAGTLRAAWCQANGREPTDQDAVIDRLHLHGPLQATWGGTHAPQLWLPAPANARAAVPQAAGGQLAQAVALQPTAPPRGAGCDLPFGMLPLLPPPGIATRLTEPPPRLWSLTAIVDWLCRQTPLPQPASKPEPQPATQPATQPAPWLGDAQALDLPQCEEQVHIRIDASRQVEDGAFFVNLACDYTLPGHLAHTHGRRGLWVRCEVRGTTERQRASRFRHPEAEDLLAGYTQVAGQAWRLGADGALAMVTQHQGTPAIGAADLARLDASLQGLCAGDSLCLMLATPGCFGANGWFPWLRRDEPAQVVDGKRQPLPPQPVPEGRLPGWPPGWRFRLRAAAVGTALPQGSLKLRSGRAARPLAAALRKLAQPAGAAGLGRLQWLVPAGSMYWFEVVQAGGPPPPGSLQLRPCGEAQFARDGHALALLARTAPLPTTASH